MKMDAANIVRLIEPLVYEAGLDPGALNATHIAATIDSRRRELGLPDVAAYVGVLKAASAELDWLLEQLFVGETRFFRDARVWESLIEWLPALAKATDGPLRLLSAPCSTGEEAWSLAAAMRVAGIALERFTVDAIDLSAKALRVAEKGIYPATSLRDLDDPWVRTTFQRSAKSLKVHADLMARVRFLHRSLAAENALGEDRYHVILCRNLFIYLHPEARARLALSLQRALLPGGRLIVGSADHVKELGAVFQAVKPGSTFAYETIFPADGHLSTGLSTRWLAAPERKAQPQQPALPKLDATVSAAEFYRRALEGKAAGNIRLAERRCRQALYLQPEFLPAMELLQHLWTSVASSTLRRALAARIERARAAG